MSKLKAKKIAIHHKSFSSTKAGQLFESLSDDEKSQFTQFINSPFFDASEDDLKLLELVQEKPELTKAEIHHFFFYNSSYDNNRVNKILRNFNSALNDFLAALELKADALLAQKLLVKAKGKRRLFVQYQAGIADIEKQIKQSPYQDYSYYQELFLLNESVFFHPETQKFQKEVSSLRHLCDNLDKAYILKKVQINCELLTRKNSWKDQKSPFLLEETTAYIEENLPQPSFQIFAKLTRLLQQQSLNPAKFEELIAYYKTHLSLFKEPMQAVILQMLINYSNKIYLSGQLDYQIRNFELYKFGIDEGLFLINGQMSDAIFCNMVTVATLAGKFDFVKKFIKDNQHRLAPEIRVAAVNFSKSFLAFHQKKYNEAIKFLNLIEATSLDYKLRIKSIEIRSHYHLFVEKRKNKPFLDALIKNFKSFLKNKYFQDMNVTAYLNMITVLNELKKSFNKPASVRRILYLDLLKRVSEPPAQTPNTLQPIVAKKWIIEKIKELL